MRCYLELDFYSTAIVSISNASVIHEKKCTLFHEYFSSLYDVKLMRFLNMRCRNQQDAEDIFQETFINVLKYIDGYRTEYAFSTWPGCKLCLHQAGP